MANRNYEAGRRYEDETVALFEAAGWLAFRTAGSHSPWDVVAVSDDRKYAVEVLRDAGYERTARLGVFVKRTPTITRKIIIEHGTASMYGEGVTTRTIALMQCKRRKRVK